MQSFLENLRQFEEGCGNLKLLQMSEGNNKKQNEKKETDSSSKQKLPLPSNKEKKLKKTLKFQLPDDVHSQESFTPALSHYLTDVGNDSDGAHGHEDFTSQSRSSNAIHKKYVLSSLKHSSPRSVNTRFKYEPFSEDDHNSLASVISSPWQLLEISRNSPTPSEADINLIEATYSRKLGAVKEAIRNGANVNTYKNGQTPLLIAAEIGDTRLVSYLLTVPNIDLDLRNDFGQTALSVAVRNSFDRIVRLLLINRADVNMADKMNRIPLHNALFQQRVGLVRLLLTYGADYEKQDCFEERPIYISAINKPDLDCLLVLLKTGATPEYYNSTGISLLSRTILKRTEFKIIEALVSYGASVNSRDFTSGKTPLHFAALANYIEIAEFLVSKGADVNIKTTYHLNPCEEAIVHGSVAVIDFLEDKTQNVNVIKFASIKRDTSFPSRKRKDIFSITDVFKKKKKKRKKK